jgi:hypothetical protein
MKYQIAMSLVAFLVATALAAQRQPVPRTYPRTPANTNFDSKMYVLQNDDYGFTANQALANLNVTLTAKRADATTTKGNVVDRAGEVVATAKTGAGGGVTFPNVKPGTYVVLIEIVEASAGPNARRTHCDPVQVASLSDPQIYLVKSYFESRSNIANKAMPNGQTFLFFKDTNYLYAVRAPNIVLGEQEMRWQAQVQRNGMVRTIAQEFEIGGDSATAVRVAIGVNR